MIFLKYFFAYLYWAVVMWYLQIIELVRYMFVINVIVKHVQYKAENADIVFCMILNSS